MTENEALVARNREIRQWGGTARRKMLGLINSLGMTKGHGDTAAMLKDVYSGRPIHRVGFRIPKHAIFAHQGVGRGYPIAVAKAGGRPDGYVQMRKAGYSRGHLGGIQGRLMRPRRTAKPFLNPVLDQMLPALADIVAQHGATVFTSQLFIK